jgi:hypothetical protein
MRFFANYGIQKGKDLMRVLGEAIVKFDPEGATEAAIAEIEQKFDELNLAFSKAKQTWKKENDESESIQKLYNQRLAAAEFLQQDPTKADALNQLLTILEDMLPDVKREKQEAEEAKNDMDQLELLVNQYAEKLKQARNTVENARKAMERAELQKQRAKDAADAAAMAAGLSQKTSELSIALDHMNKLTVQANTEADAANNKTRLLQPTKVEENPDIKAAMDAVAGKTVSPSSIEDRLSLLKKELA